MADSNSDRKVTIEELKEHSSAGDLWLAIDGKVYDVSDFMDEHPGGSDVMMDVAGVDATDEYVKKVAHYCSQQPHHNTTSHNMSQTLAPPMLP